MANNFVNMDVIAAEALVQLENSLVAANLLYRDKTADFGSQGGYAVGDTVRIKTRPDFTVNEFTTTTVEQDIRESNTNFIVDKHLDITVGFTAKQMSLDIDSLSEQVIAPAMRSMAQKVDSHLLTKLWDSRGLYTNAAPLSTSALIADARKSANEQQIDTINRIGLIDSTLESSMLGQSEFTRFDHRGADAQFALREASLGKLMGINWFSSLNIDTLAASHVNGARASNVTDNTIGTFNAVGTSTLQVNSVAGIVNAGDRLLVAGVKRPLIVSTQAATLATAILLAHPIDEIIPNGAAVTIIGGVSTANVFRGVICSPDAFAFAAPPLEDPAGVDSSVITSNGISVRVVRDYTISTKKNLISFDMLLGGVAYDARKSMIISDV